MGERRQLPPRSSPTRWWHEHELAGGRCVRGGAPWPRCRGIPHGAAAFLLDRVRPAARKNTAAAGMALCLQEDVAGVGGCMASGREAGAGGGVAEGAAA